MADWKYSNFKIGDLVIKAPIVQGGMGVGISLSSLASAVSNEGGVGVISAAGIGMLFPERGIDLMQANINALKSEIRKARSISKGVLGVNIMVALSNFGEMVKAAVEENIDIIFAGAGLPLSLPGFLSKESKTKLVPIVSSAKAVNVIAKWWNEKYQYVPDAFVVEGPMAGGHLGFTEEQLENPAFSLEKLVPEVLGETKKLEEKINRKIPVIAAGGIFTGADIARFTQIGASAVQMATRFVATEECDASDEFKNAYVRCEKDDIKIIKSPVGMPGRAIVNDYIRQMQNGEKMPVSCPYHCIKTCRQDQSPYCICLALINACKGHLINGFAFTGANGYRVREITTVKKLMDDLHREYTDYTKNGESL
ncbi:MAG: nitronate monooxygenase family protein [Bacillota bacterium]|nr:nitronate monooxygenase family protein [Bacillota bacterium]